MGVNAYLKDNVMKLYFDRDEQSLVSEFEYNLGEQLLNYIWFPINNVIEKYEESIGLYR